MALHVLAAAGWFGSTLMLAVASDRPAVARAFHRVAWPSLALVVVSGVWSVLVVPRRGSIDWAVLLFAKLVLVTVSAAGGVLQARVSSRLTFAVGTVLAVGGALAAMVLGVVLAR